ncbi:hypothetical protein GCM10022245_20380 [Streptomyces mayteni]
MREALSRRDVAGVFKLVQQFTGASQARIATAIGMTQARVNEIINGRREVVRLDVFERIADGLGMPDDARRLLGLAPAHSSYRDGAARDLLAFPEVVCVYPGQASAADEIRRLARLAREIDVLAVRGLGLIGLNDSLLRPSLVRVDGLTPTLRILLLAPSALAIPQRAGEIGESEESLASGVQLTEAALKGLRASCDIQVYRYHMLPTWRVIRIDSTMFVSAFDVGWEGHESAMCEIAETVSGPLYHGFRRMFEAILAGSERTI